jgi:hypothetical protein
MRKKQTETAHMLLFAAGLQTETVHMLLFAAGLQTETAHMLLFAAGLQVTLQDRIINERHKKSIAVVEVVKKYKIN